MRALILLLIPLTLGAQNATLLILHKGAGSLGFYTPAGRLLATVPVGSHPHEMARSLDGRYVFTTDNGTMQIEEPGSGGNTVSIVDLAARKKTGEISLGEYRRPHGISFDRASGLLAVTCELPDRLLAVDPVRRTVVRSYETRGKTSHMVTLTPWSAWAFVSNSSSNAVAAISLANAEVVLIPVGARPEGSALSPDERQLYVCNRESASISVIDTVNKRLAGRIPTGKGPVRIAVTPDGRRLVYACMHDQAVEWADPAARKVLGSVKLGGSPVSLSLSRDGTLAYASDQANDTVYVVSLTDRKIVRTIRTPKGSGPDPVMEIPAR